MLGPYCGTCAQASEPRVNHVAPITAPRNRAIIDVLLAFVVCDPPRSDCSRRWEQTAQDASYSAPGAMVLRNAVVVASRRWNETRASRLPAGTRARLCHRVRSHAPGCRRDRLSA